MSASASARERQEPGAESVLGAALFAAVLYGAALLVPLLFVFAAVSPLPLIILRVRGSVGNAVGAAVCAAALLAAAFSPGQGTAFFLFLALPGLVLGDTMARGRGLVRACGWAFALVALEVAGALVFAHDFMQAQALKPFAYYSSPQFLQEVRAAGFSPEQIDSLSAQFSAFRAAMAVVYPAVYLIMGALLVLANGTLLGGYLARRDPGWLEGGEFESLRMPMGLAVVFVAAGLAVLAPALRPLAYNALLLVAFFFALQGLAVVAFYTRRLAAPPLLRWGVLLLVVVNPWAPQILGLVGLFDTWFDFRKWAEPPAAGAA